VAQEDSGGWNYGREFAVFVKSELGPVRLMRIAVRAELPPPAIQELHSEIEVELINQRKVRIEKRSPYQRQSRKQSRN
jgi:hypothetical protein